MLPTNLTALEVFDMGIHCETLAFRMYDTLSRRIEVPTIQTRLIQLKKDEKDHRKTLRAHRKGLFAAEPPCVSEEEAVAVFGPIDVGSVNDKESLIQALYGAVRYEEYSAYFYDKLRHRVPNNEARIFLEVLASEGRFHAQILKQQIEVLRSLTVSVDERGHTALASRSRPARV